MDLRGKVVVVTGASAGLGRETAVEFARRGCTVVVAARRLEALEHTARMCRDAGGNALPIVTDVTREDDVQALAQRTLTEHGHIDVWVNNAGVTLFGSLEDAPLEEHRRVIDTNLWGAIHGARAVVPVFRRQRRGVLVNVGSVLSKIGQPFVPSYVISKFGLRGLSEALRFELADEPDIHVCSVLPYAMNTQHFQSGANYIGWQPRAMPPAQSPRRVARAIVGLTENPRRELMIPRTAELGLAMHAVAPRTVERLLLRGLREWHFADTAEAPSSGGLFESPREPARVSGKRPPQLSPARLVWWGARELVRIGAESAARRLRRAARGPAALTGETAASGAA